MIALHAYHLHLNIHAARLFGSPSLTLAFAFAMIFIHIIIRSGHVPVTVPRSLNSQATHEVEHVCISLVLVKHILVIAIPS